MKQKKTVSLDEDIVGWVDAQPRSFSFSEYVNQLLREKLNMQPEPATT